LSIQDLLRQIEYTVAFLNSRGIGKGDAVAVTLPNGPELASAFLAISAGSVCCPLNPAYLVGEFSAYLRDLRVKAVLTEDGFCPAVEQAAQAADIPLIGLKRSFVPDRSLWTLEGGRQGSGAEQGFSGPDDVALLLHSSGTTSRPKRIPLTHRNLCSSAANIGRTLELTPADRCLNVMPLFHVHGLIGGLLASLVSGAQVVCTPGFDALRWPRWLQEHRSSWMTAVPTMYQALLRRQKHASALAQSGLRFLRSSSAPLHPQVLVKLESLFECPVLNAYGMTEGAHQITTNLVAPQKRKIGSVGVATATEVVVLDDAGTQLGPNSKGELAIRGPAVTSGYQGPPAINLEAFRNGWLRTGDEGAIDENGFVSLTGRLKEIVNCGGEKISPAEIDEVLMEHPKVMTAVAFGRRCPIMGERVCAAVVLEEGMSVTEHELQHFLRNRLAHFKVPKQLVVVKEIPLGPTGKMQRNGMAERLGVA
jgi:acyl-CoA synthetase (AMP-forming)/AMP-acid ligase II